MLVNKAERTPQDATRVDLDQEWDVEFWCAKFSVTPNELRACVLQVGPRAEDIDEQLKKAARESFRLGGED